jgi:hypothetical protein
MRDIANPPTRATVNTHPDTLYAVSQVRRADRLHTADQERRAALASPDSPRSRGAVSLVNRSSESLVQAIAGLGAAYWRTRPLVLSESR